MKVTNINGTSQATCKCGSWLEHWKNFSGQVLSKWCSEKKCTKPPELGAHVRKGDSADRGWYIVPLCDKHDAQTGKSLDLVDGVRLVSANVKKTCGN